MSQTLHQIYQSKAIVVTRTMVIKFHKIAEAINADVRSQGYVVDETNPATWKYYMNMFGEYHESDRARLLALSSGAHDSIRIKVAGETQPIEIDFNKGNISGANGDVAIANEYRFNTFYFNELVNRYPEFEDLILGILNPISTDISTVAREGEILYCGGYVKTRLASGIYHYVRQDYGIITDNYLIEPNEENLIPKLQDHIYNFLERWWNAGYGVTSNLFLTTFIALLYLSIPQILGNIRLGNAKTPFAHTFHIREHLESWGGLGWVAEYLSKGVLLWLYRNMVWLNANRGKAKVMDNIIANVLTPTNIPITAFRLRHDVEEMSEDVLASAPFLEQTKLNFSKNSTPVRNEIIDIINAEISLATENYYDQQGQADQVSDRSKWSMFDNLNTKVLESTVIDDSNKVPFTLEDVALNYWCFTASRGDYRGTVIFTNPVDNERIQLTPLNAYILSWYCFNRGWANLDFEDIPTMYARLIPRHPLITPDPVKHPVKPKLADVARGVIKPFITDVEMSDILGTFVPTYKHNSTTNFGREVEAIHKEALRKYATYARIEDAQGRGFGEWVAHKCYWYDVECPLVKQPTKYRDWLTVQGLELDNYSRKDFVALGLKIVEAAVGVDIHRSDLLRNRQSAALAILKHFSSYTVQLIQNTVASDSYWLAWKHTRLTNLKSRAAGHIQAQLPLFTVKDHWSIREGVLNLDMYTRDHYEIRKETLSSQEDTSESKVTVTKIKLTDSARYKYPTMGIVGMVIPEVNTETYQRTYSYLTTGTYPYGAGEAATAAATIGREFHLVKPKIVKPETITTLTRMVGNIQIKTPGLGTDEGFTANARLLSMALNTHDIGSTEQFTATGKVVGQFTMLKPGLSIVEEVNAHVDLDGITLSNPKAQEFEGVKANAKILPTMIVEKPTPINREAVETLSQILSISMVTITNPVSDQLETNTTVINDFVLLNPHPIDTSNVEATATILSISLLPEAE